MLALVQAPTDEQYYYGTGKRKTSIAKVRLYLDDGGLILINGKPMEEYFNWQPWQRTVTEPFKVSEIRDKIEEMMKEGSSA